MEIKIYNKDKTKSLVIRPINHYCSENKYHIWINKCDGEGGTFDADEIADIIYNAIEKYFIDNF